MAVKATARRIVGIVLMLTLSACAEGFVEFPVTRSSQENLPDDVEIIRLDAGNIESFSRPANGHGATTLPADRAWDYRVGVGDILNVIVFDHPELTMPAGPERSAEQQGFRVQVDGTFFYPFIGQVDARGRAPEDIRVDITRRLADFIPEPQVEVRVAAFNSQSIVVTGEVNTPNRQPLTTSSLSLIEAINAAGGMTDEAAPRRVTVQRHGRTYRVDVEGFLEEGIRANNPILRDGDVVNVPRRRAQEAYLLGEVREPEAVDLSYGPVTLTQAITRQGGLEEVRADARGIFVFRAVGHGIRVFQLNASTPVGLLLGTRFVLEPADVVYIVRSPLQRWNDTISSLLPTVRAVSAVDSAANVAN